ncbi:MAG: F0F1 ATP synthase subunit delta [Campylobacteraceae bacterium]|nr:F0F1 ATP synthase subunit delta [Campylobacteraceae bacterium]
MVSSVSKKYTKAMTSLLNEAQLAQSYKALKNISGALKISKFQDILGSKDVSIEQKAALLSEISESNDAKLANLFYLLLKAKRIEIVPAIAEEIREYLAVKSGKAEGTATASFDVAAEDIKEISRALSSKLNREIELSFVKTDASNFNGIKVEIEDLGVEVEINKDALKKSIIAHILNTTKIF